MKKIVIASSFFICFGILAAGLARADTVIMKDGKEVKGIVLEEYKDRMLISTVDGERSLMKEEIKELYFDTEEQNLIKLAEQARDKGDFVKSFAYYEKAFKANPNSKAAKDGIVFLQGYMFKKDVARKEEDVSRRNDFEARGSISVTIKTEEEKFMDDVNKLRETVGITIKTQNAQTFVDTVAALSPAYEAGIRKSDILVAVWGRFVKYLSTQEVVETLLEKTSLETKCTIERDIDVGAKDLGPELKMQFDGMVVSQVRDSSAAKEAGLKDGDMIMAINGNNTRYMPLKKALELIKGSNNGMVRLTVRRDLVIWGK